MTQLENSILQILKVVDKPTWYKVTFLFEEIHETLAILSRKTRRNIYESANGKCECCGRTLRIGEGDFHLFNGSNKEPNSLAIQFLCPTDHRIHGHVFISGRILAQPVGKHKSPYWYTARKRGKGFDEG